MLGTSAWEQELYARQGGFFSELAQPRRTADVAGLEAYVQNRLKTIFPAVLPPLALPMNKKPQKFSLFFAMSNPAGPAIGLATRIANHILKPGRILKAGTGS